MASLFRQLHFRNCQEWKDDGLSLSTTSDEAAKLLDAGIAQYVALYEAPEFKGLEGTANAILEADPHFVMGRVLILGLDLIGSDKSTRIDAKFAASVDQLVSDAANAQHITEREKLHVEAVQLWSQGYLSKACDVWERILLDHPNDLLALKLCQDTNFFLSRPVQIRDSVSRVLPQLKPSMQLYGHIKGMHAFGLEETNLYPQAELAAREALARCPEDAWASHALAHVMEMQGRQEEGIHFMHSTEHDWSQCGLLACHNYWHLALYRIEKAEHEEAVCIYDNQVAPRAFGGGMLNLVDAVSFLKRLELEGVNVGNRWTDLQDVCRPHLDDHVLAFNDVHLLMSFLNAKKPDVVDKHVKSISDFMKCGIGNQAVVLRSSSGWDVCQGIMAFEQHQYGEAVRFLHSAKYSTVHIGGSHAQRDVFNLLLINACLLSQDPKDVELGRRLLNERHFLKPNSPMTRRLYAKYVHLHDGEMKHTSNGF